MSGSRISPFIPTNRRSQEYAQGYRAGVKAAGAWLQAVAIEKNNRAASRVLSRAAQEMAEEAKAISMQEDSWGSEAQASSAIAAAVIAALQERNGSTSGTPDGERLSDYDPE